MNGKPKTIKSWTALPKSGLILLTGFRGEGKSALAWFLAERHHNLGGQVAAFDFTPQARKALPRWIKHVNSVGEVAHLKPSFLIIDEGALKIHARRAQSASNVEWTKLLAIARHKDHLAVLIGQHNRQIDVGLVADADWVVMKRPSELHLRFARPELRPELEEAFTGFLAHHGNSKSLSYVVDYNHGKRGWLRNRLPTFWSTKLSKSFAAVELEATEVITKAKHQQAAIGASRREGK